MALLFDMGMDGRVRLIFKNDNNFWSMRNFSVKANIDDKQIP